MTVRVLPAALASLFVALVLAACATVAPQHVAAPQPIASPNDPLAYRYLVLDNSLPVLLVSDPDTQKAAASLDVLVGSADDPRGRGGMAHFLEHMLFLGTEKYPDAAEYTRYLSEHGGSYNAFTSTEHTNYFFDVREDALDGALDRFAQFFIGPQFDETYVEREMNAVEAEYRMRINSDAWRGLSVLQAVMNPAHPYSEFRVGSLETLADQPGSPIRDALIDMYRTYYVASNMRLAVYGKESLDELEALVRPMFAAVAEGTVARDVIAEPLFDEARLPLWVEMVPEGTARELRVSFPLPDYRPYYDVKPLQYLGNLIGHEGEGSLLSLLKAEGLAESLGAGTALEARGASLFSVGITLTERGVAERERVVQLLFAYLDMIRERGPQDWLFDEQRRLGDMNFRFREKGQPQSYVLAIANDLHYYPPEDVLRGNFLMERYDASLLTQALDGLRPERAVVQFIDASATTDARTPYYDVPYSAQTVVPERLAAWQAVAPEPQLVLPAPNEFIASDFTLYPVAAAPAAGPQRQVGPLLDQWVGRDPDFRIPRGALYVNFRSDRAGSTAREAAATQLYVSLLSDAVNEFAYPASLARLDFSLYRHAGGVSLRVSGYNEKQLVLLERIVETLAAPAFSPARFADIKADYERALSNRKTRPATTQVFSRLQELLIHGNWSDDAILEAIGPLTLADIEAHAAVFWQSVDTEVMLYGNYTDDTPAAVAAVVERLLPPQRTQPSPQRVVQLPAGQRWLYPVAVEHDDSVVIWYVQGMDNTLADRAALGLTSQIIRSDFFESLRTEQQLGYSVGSSNLSPFDVPGLVLYVQSPNADAVRVDAAIRAFVQDVTANVTPEQFGRFQTALQQQILEPPKNLFERAEQYWQAIAKRDLDFSQREQLAAAVGALDLPAWQAYFTEAVLTAPREIRAVSVGSSGVLPGSADTVIDHPLQLRESLPFYSIP